MKAMFSNMLHCLRKFECSDIGLGERPTVNGIQLRVALEKHDRERPAVAKSSGANRPDRPRDDNFANCRLPKRSIFDL
jgi:hypothetical protein